MPKTITRKPLMKTEGFTFDPVAHVYTLDGKPLHGVTSILKVIGKGDALVNWAANCAVDYVESNFPECFMEAKGDPLKLGELMKDVLKQARIAHRLKKEAAGEAGTDVHAKIEEIIKEAISLFGGTVRPVITDDMPAQVSKFVEWAVHNNVRFLASEQRLYSREFWYAGTADFICEKDGRLYVGDVKTSSAIYPEHFIQASAYAMALEEMCDNDEMPFELNKYHGVIIVNIPKKGGLNVKENYDLKGNFECFKSALTIHKYLNA